MTRVVWPLDQIWALGQKLVLLVALVGAWSVLTRRGPTRFFTGLFDTTSPDVDPPQLRAPRGQTFAGLLALALLVSGVAWASTVAFFGLAQTVAMALGGPTAESILVCRKRTSQTERAGGRVMCIHGGKMTRAPDGLHCSKHGHVLVRSP